MTKSINRPCRAVSSPRAILLKLWSPYSSSVTSVSPLWCLAAVADSPERRWKVWLIPSEEIPLRFVVPAQLRLEERNSAETRNSALAQARRSLVERLAWWWTWGTKCGAEGAQLGLLMWTTSVFFFFHLKIFRVKDGDFFLSPSRHTVWGANQTFSRLREDNSKYQGTREPLLHEDICNTLGWLHSLSPTKDRSLAGVRSECSDSVINSPPPWDRGRDLRSLRAGNVFWRTRPWRIGGRWMPEMSLETQGWKHDWWEKNSSSAGEKCSWERVYPESSGGSMCEGAAAETGCGEVANALGMNPGKEKLRKGKNAATGGEMKRGLPVETAWGWGCVGTGALGDIRVLQSLWDMIGLTPCEENLSKTRGKEPKAKAALI